MNEGKRREKKESKTEYRWNEEAEANDSSENEHSNESARGDHGNLLATMKIFLVFLANTFYEESKNSGQWRKTHL